jgi:hypothetical protein
VALETCKLRNVPITGYYRRMALLALYASCDVSLVVEGKCLADPDIAPRLKVAGVTAGNIRLLILCFVEMADKALHIGHRHVGALDDLRMAGGAAKLLLPFHLLDVARMAEEYILENHFILQIRSLVTTALETTCVVYFRMRPGRTLPGHKIDQGQLAVLPLAFKMVGKSRLVVTLDARDFPMGRGLPGIDVHLHVMAHATEGRRLRYLEEKHRNDDKADQHKSCKNGDPFPVLQGALLRLGIEILKERLYEVVKASEHTSRLDGHIHLIAGADHLSAPRENKLTV